MKLTVYKNQYGYSTLCKGKDRDGNEQKCYMSVQFKRGLEPSGEKTYMEIEDAFFSCYTDKNGTTIPKIVIMSWYPDESRSNYGEKPKEDYGTPLEEDYGTPLADLQDRKEDEPFAYTGGVSLDDLPF